LRLSDPERREFSYRFVHRLTNGSTRETEPVVTTTALIAVNDPFEDPLIVEFFPNYDGTNINTLFLDVAFNDATLGINRQEQLRFIGQTFESQRLRFARSSPTIRELSFQITILGKDNSVRRLPPVLTENTIVFLGEHIRSEEAARRRAMGYIASQESKARTSKGQSDGKTYGYQSSEGVKTGNGAASSLASAKAQLIDAFEQFVDVLVGSYQPPKGGAPQQTGGNGSSGKAGNGVLYDGKHSVSQGSRGTAGTPSGSNVEPVTSSTGSKR
jgi:hypothetical protein